MSEFGTSSSTPLSPEQIEQKKQQGRTNYYLRLPLSYVPFFQAMARDYYQRGKIKSPTIGLLAKTCLITAGNSWNRMQVQQMNKGYEKKSRQVELERQRHQQQQQDHQERGEFVQSSGDIASQSHRSAKNIPWSQAVNDNDDTFKSADELKKLYESKGITPDKEVITYCRIDERS